MFKKYLFSKIGFFCVILLFNVPFSSSAQAEPCCNWVTATINATSSVGEIRNIVRNNSQVLAFAKGNVILRSTDGKVWNEISHNMYNTPSDVIWDGAKYIAIGGLRIFTSPDGISWAELTLPTIVTLPGDVVSLYGVTYTGSQYVAIGNAGVILTSTDGYNWQNNSLDYTTYINLMIFNVANNGSRYVAAGQYGAMLTSTNGVDWSIITPPVSGHFHDVKYANGLFMVVGQTTSGSTLPILLTSVDGVNWQSKTISNRTLGNKTLTVLVGALAGDSRHMVLGGRSSVVVSEDSTTWTKLNPTHEEDISWYVGLWDGNRYIVGGRNNSLGGELMYSDYSVDISLTNSPLNFITNEPGYLTVYAQNLSRHLNSSSVQVNINLPANAQLISVSPSTECSQTAPVICNFISIPASGRRTISMQLSFNTAVNGALTASATTTGDINLSNNSLNETITVSNIPIAVRGNFTIPLYKTLTAQLQAVTSASNLEYQVLTSNLSGIFNLNASTGEFTYTNTGFNGREEFSFRVRDIDNNLYSSYALVTLDINDTPIAFADTVTFYSNQVDGLIILEAQDSETLSTQLEYIIETPPVYGSLVKSSGNNLFVYTPYSTPFVSDSFWFSASDGKSTSELAFVNILYEEVLNNPPTVDSQAAPPASDGGGSGGGSLNWMALLFTMVSLLLLRSEGKINRIFIEWHRVRPYFLHYVNCKA